MNSYYQNVLKNVVDLFSKGEYEKADAIVSSELELPYIPQDAQDLLEQYHKECAPYLSKASGCSRQDLEKWVNGTAAQKEMAASALQSMNLRQYDREVQTLLNAPDLLDEFKGELIEALMEQKIDREFSIEKNGLDISFVPSLILPAKEDRVLIQARDLLDRWLSCDNPSMAHFCLQLLEQEILETRPFDFSETDSQALAASLVRLVFLSMKDEPGWAAFQKEHQLEHTQEYPLLIEKRG